MEIVQETFAGTGLVSVLMTSYNRENYIAEAIESVLGSSYSNFELIIVDDGSKDRTVSIAESYRSKDKRVRVVINEKNLGDYPNRNNASTYASGEFILYVDSDDSIYPDSIDYCVTKMREFPTADMGMVYVVGRLTQPVLLAPEEALHRHFFGTPYLLIGPGGTFLRRSFFEKTGKYPTRYGPANDMYFNLKAANNGTILLFPYEFLNYRRHEGQELNNEESYLTNTYIFLRDALNELDLKISPKEKRWVADKNRRRFMVNMSKYFLKGLRFKKTFEKLKKAQFGFADACKGVFHFN